MFVHNKLLLTELKHQVASGLAGAGKTEWAHALMGGLSLRGVEGSYAGLTANVPESEETKKEPHQSMKLFLRRTDNVFHNSRQVAKGPTNLVHGNTGSRLRIQGSWLMVNG